MMYAIESIAKAQDLPRLDIYVIRMVKWQEVCRMH